MADNGFPKNSQVSNYTRPKEKLKLGLPEIWFILLNIPNIVLIAMLLFAAVIDFIVLVIPLFWLAGNPFLTFCLVWLKLFWLSVVVAGGYGLVKDKKYLYGYTLVIISYYLYFMFFNGNLVFQTVEW